MRGTALPPLGKRCKQLQKFKRVAFLASALVCSLNSFLHIRQDVSGCCGFEYCGFKGLNLPFALQYIGIELLTSMG